MQVNFKGMNIDIPATVEEMYEPADKPVLNSYAAVASLLNRLYPSNFEFEHTTDGIALSSGITPEEYIDDELPPGAVFENFNSEREKELTHNLRSEKTRLFRLRLGKLLVIAGTVLGAIGAICLTMWCVVKYMYFIEWLNGTAWAYADKCADGSFLGVSAITLALLVSILLALAGIGVIIVGIAFGAVGWVKYSEWYVDKATDCKQKIGELKKDLLDEIESQNTNDSRWSKEIEKIKVIENLLGKELADEYKKIKEA